MSNEGVVRKTLRLPENTQREIKELFAMSPFVNESEFIRHVVNLGLNKYRETLG